MQMLAVSFDAQGGLGCHEQLWRWLERREVFPSAGCWLRVCTPVQGHALSSAVHKPMPGPLIAANLLLAARNRAMCGRLWTCNEGHRHTDRKFSVLAYKLSYMVATPWLTVG